MDYYGIKGYDSYFSNRTNKKGGGTALYIKSDFTHECSIVGTYEVKSCLEVTTVKINISANKVVFVSCIYRAPNTNVELFTKKCVEFLELYKGKTLYICGDFNIDLIKYTQHTDTTAFLDTLLSYNMYPLICKPTRIGETSTTLIDNIFTNERCTKVKNYILIDDISDHLPVFTVADITNKPCKSKGSIKIRKLNERNVNVFREKLKEVDWCCLNKFSDVDECYEYFLNVFLKLFDESCPFQNVKNKNNKPWFTNGLINVCKKKNILYKKWLLRKDVHSEQRYKRYKNKLTQIIRKAEKLYFKEKLARYKGDVKKTWATINEVIRKGKMSKKQSEYMFKNSNKVYDKQEMANMFNDFYINVGPKLAGEIDLDNIDVQYDSYIKGLNILESMYICPSTEDEILKIINGFKSKASQDTNGISMILIKQV